MKRGDRVIVKVFENRGISRRYWGDVGADALICTEEAFQAWQAGEWTPEGVQVPKDSLFVFDAGVFNALKEIEPASSSIGLEEIWARATSVLVASKALRVPQKSR